MKITPKQKKAFLFLLEAIRYGIEYNDVDCVNSHLIDLNYVWSEVLQSNQIEL